MMSLLSSHQAESVAHVGMLNQLFHHLYWWCEPDASVDRSLYANNSIRSVHILPFVPCGRIEVYEPHNESLAIWEITVHPSFGLQIDIILLEMDDSSLKCYYSALILDELFGNRWYSRKRWRFCGNPLHSTEQSTSNRMRLVIRQTNVLQFYNLTARYQIQENAKAINISNRISYWYDATGLKPRQLDGLNIKQTTKATRIVWFLRTDFGRTLYIKDVMHCCFSGSITIHEGLELYYRRYALLDIQHNQTHQDVLSLQLGYFEAVVTVSISDMVARTGNVFIFILHYYATLIPQRQLPINSVTRVRSTSKLFHEVYAVERVGKFYPRIAFKVVSFYINNVVFMFINNID